MAGKCFDTDLLAYSGTSQTQRLLEALQATYAKVDERSSSDLILFAQKYAWYINYFDFTNVTNGDWQNFLSKDVSVTISNIAEWRIKNLFPFIQYITLQARNAGTDAEAKKFFKVIFDLIFTLATQLNQALNRLPADIGFSNYLSVAISSNLAIPLQLINAYYQSFKTASLINEASLYADPLMPVDAIVFSGSFSLSSLSAGWQTSVTSAPITLTGTVRDDINHILTHNLFTGPLQSFINGVISIVNYTPAYLEETLNNYPLHEPYYALYLAFLRLFRFAQDHLNTYTKNHLDFYYHDVLRLTNRIAEPDFVHLVFELQKNSSSHLLKTGTSFKAGKDAANNDLFYSLTNDLVIQKAGVQAMRSLYLDKNIAPGLHASSVADSGDGKGGKLISVDKSWFAFGASTETSADTGFAIASNLLFLNEGARKITLTFQCDSLAGIATADILGIFTIQLTGKKNWYTAGGYQVLVDTTGATFSLIISMEGDAPPIIPYSQKIHSGNFTVLLPMIRILLQNYQSYGKLKSVIVKSIQVEVTATAKNLNLQNDDGKINAAKPFKPFGEFPGTGASFIIGSNEIFQKRITSFITHIDWQHSPASSSTADAYALTGGVWPATACSSAIGLNTSSFSINPAIGAIPLAEPDFVTNADYNIMSVAGFIKLSFNNNNYDTITSYLDRVKTSISQTSATLQKDTSGNVTGFTLNPVAVQQPPAPPVIKALSIEYTASEEIALQDTAVSNFNSRTNYFYHLEPFGFREMHGDLTSDALTLLPVFNLDNNSPKDTGGELWIGLKDALPAEIYSLLFKVSDGSANPLKNITRVNWYYLSDNNWLLFDHLSVTDQTNQFSTSGLVVLNVPEEATTSNTRADNGLLWVKAVVDHDTDAVCRLIAVRCNAAKTVFTQDLSKNIEFTNALPSNTISKPAIPDASLKKTEQPYSSFGGRMHETDDQFYVRVSERLRHKHRAVTTYDYERLVLQYFPQIHKAKCINHTGFVIDEKTNNKKYSELLPGHVMVITLPDLQNKLAVNPLRPYTSVGLLDEIKKYLSSLTSPFVRLEVTNPQFEEVQFDFGVSFHPDYDPTYCRNLLIEEIEQFLTPWAFSSGKDIEFGGKIEKSVILNFIEERYYVDFVTCFKMNHIIFREGITITQALYDVEEAIASTARSILVSYYNEITKVKHLITSPANCNCNG